MFKKFFPVPGPGSEDVRQDIDGVIRRLQDGAFYIAITFGTLALIGALLPIVRHGWNNSHLVDIGVYLLIVTALALRKALNPSLSIVIICLAFGLDAIFSLATEGLTNVAALELGVACVLLIIVRNLRSAILAAAACTAVFAVVGYGVCTGIFTLPNLNRYAVSPSSWAMQASLFLALTITVVILIHLIKQRLIQSLLESREREKTYRLLSENMRDVIFVQDMNLNITYASPSARAIFGYDLSEIPRLKMSDLLTPESLQDGLVTFKEHVTRALRDRGYQPPLMQYEYVRKDKSTFWGELHVAFQFDASGAITGVQGVMRDITERKRAELDARRALAEAEQANAAKSEFVSRMSHELRTPLTSILGFTELYCKEHGELLRDDERKMFKTVERNGKYLLKLINSLLHLGKIEAGTIELELENVDLVAQLRDITGWMNPQFHGKNLEFELVMPPAVPPVRTDKSKLNEVLLNIIENAIKYTAQGKITVRLHPYARKGDLVRIDVADTGEGIPPEQLIHGFIKFEQGQPGYKRKFGGTGIGLVVAKAIMDRLGGRIEVASTVGKGSTFSVIFPYQPAN